MRVMFSGLNALVCVGGKSTKGQSREKTHMLFGGKQNHTTKCKIIALIGCNFFFSLTDFNNPKPDWPVLGSHEPDLVPLQSASHEQGSHSPLPALALISTSVPHPLQEEGCGKENMNHRDFESLGWPSLCYQAVSFDRTIHTGFL